MLRNCSVLTSIKHFVVQAFGLPTNLIEQGIKILRPLNNRYDSEIGVVTREI